MKRKRIPVLALIAMAMTAIACSLTSPTGKDDAPTDSEARGAGFFSWGSYVYVLGGYNNNGNLCSEVWKGTVSSDGSVGSWERECDLPTGIAFPSCFATGNMAYIIGGLNSSGTRSQIYYTLINSDGSLGFSSTVWETNPIQLPEARAAAAPLVLRGRIFLLGGQTASGSTASIISARLWNDGQVGQWYESPVSLPAGGEGYTASLYSGEIWLAGGSSEAVYKSAVDANGQPSSWNTVTVLEGPLLYPALCPTADGLYLLGGKDANTGGAGKTLLWDGSSWNSSASVEAWGPNACVAANTLFAPFSVAGTDAPELATVSVATACANTPRISPGSGIVKANASFRFSAYQGDTIRFTTAAFGETPSTPTDSSSELTASTKISATASYAFRAFRDNAQASESVYESYIVRSMGLLVLTQGTLSSVADMDSYTDYTLVETYSDGSKSAVSSVWYKIIVSSQSCLTLGWKDADDDSTYTATIRLSLFEGDMYTPARLQDGSQFYQLEQSADNPASMTLGSGTYYLFVESSDGSTGGSFALSLVEGK